MLGQRAAAPRHQRLDGPAGAARPRLADPQARPARHARVAAHRRHERVRPARRSNFSRRRCCRARSGFDAVLGTNFGPRSPGTVLTLLYRLAAQACGRRAALAQPQGGMGALCEALARSPTAAGAEIRHRRPVARILVERDRAAGVVLESGEQHRGAHGGLERGPQDHIPAAAGCATSRHGLRAPRARICARRAWPRSCTWRSIALPRFSGVERCRGCAAVC